MKEEAHLLSNAAVPGVPKSRGITGDADATEWGGRETLRVGRHNVSLRAEARRPAGSHYAITSSKSFSLQAQLRGQ